MVDKKSEDYGAQTATEMGSDAANLVMNSDRDSAVSEQIFPELLDAQKKKYKEFLGGADHYVGDVILERPKKRLECVEALRDEILKLNGELKDKQEQILRLIHENEYNETTDLGYLEIDPTQYDKCYHIDFDGIKTCLDEEVDRIRNELRKAKEDSDGLTQKMEVFLKQNHKMVQDFLATSHKALFNLAKPLKHRGDGNASAARIEVESNEVSEIDSANAEPIWEPELTRLPAFGLDSPKKLEWPTQADLKNLPLAQMIKLRSVELSFTSNLYEIKLNFSGGVESSVLSSLIDQTTNSRHMSKIDPMSRIADVYVCLSAKGDSIFGFRMLNEQGEYLVNQTWFESEDSVWKHFGIPEGQEIVGIHGSADDDYIRSLGLILWKPNPQAKNVRQAMGEYLTTKQ